MIPTPRRPPTASSRAPARALSEGCRTWLRAALQRADALAALPFLVAVVEQAAFPLGQALSRQEAEARERRLARESLELLLGSRDAGGTHGLEQARLADRLHRDAALLAAFFQNLDLLHAAGYPDADGASVLLMHALELAYEPLE